MPDRELFAAWGIPIIYHVIARDGLRASTFTDCRCRKSSSSDLPRHPEVTVGTAGNDLVTGRDILIGGGGNDTIIGSAGIDILVAGSGNNILEGGAGADLLDGTGGWAVAFYQRALTAVTVHLDGSGNAGDQAAGDRYINVNGVNGSNYNDTLVGNFQGNWMIGGLGNDLIDRRHGRRYASTGQKVTTR